MQRQRGDTWDAFLHRDCGAGPINSVWADGLPALEDHTALAESGLCCRKVAAGARVGRDDST